MYCQRTHSHLLLRAPNEKLSGPARLGKASCYQKACATRRPGHAGRGIQLFLNPDEFFEQLHPARYGLQVISPLQEEPMDQEASLVMRRIHEVANVPLR